MLGERMSGVAVINGTAALMDRVLRRKAVSDERDRFIGMFTGQLNEWQRTGFLTAPVGLEQDGSVERIDRMPKALSE
jgi:hypothetical protein